MLLTLLAFAIVLGVVIFVHELGHFLAAKAMGVGVPRFSIGFGNPTPLRFTRGETEYVLSWVPLGGYVKMATREDEGGVSAIEGGAGDFPPEKLFENKPLLARMFILSAGVAMNVLLAWALYAGLAIVQGEQVDPITTLAEADTTVLPAEARGLVAVPFGTQIVRINGDTVTSWNDVVRAVMMPTTDRVRFDFAGGVAPVVAAIPGTRLDARVQLRESLRELVPARVGTLVTGSAAVRAGLQVGDEIVAIAGDTVRYWFDLVRLIEPHPDQSITITVRRGDSVLALAATPTGRDTVNRQTREPERRGFLGVGPVREVEFVDIGFVAGIGAGWRQTWDMTLIVLTTVKGLILAKISPRELGGPIAIGVASGQAAREGVDSLIVMIGFISINLAIFNLLPIPVLDGGHLAFMVIEGLIGRPVSTVVRLRLTQAGLALLLALVVFVMYNDVLRLFGVR